MFKIHIDSTFFFVSKSTLDKFPQFLLTQVISGNTEDPRISTRFNANRTDKDIYIDIDPSIFSIFVTYIRGYKIDKTSLKFIENYIKEANYFNLTDLVNLLNGEIIYDPIEIDNDNDDDIDLIIQTDSDSDSDYIESDNDMETLDHMKSIHYTPKFYDL